MRPAGRQLENLGVERAQLTIWTPEPLERLLLAKLVPELLQQPQLAIWTPEPLERLLLAEWAPESLERLLLAEWGPESLERLLLEERTTESRSEELRWQQGSLEEAKRVMVVVVASFGCLPPGSIWISWTCCSD